VNGGWASSVLQAPINPTESLKTARKALNRSALAALALADDEQQHGNGCCSPCVRASADQYTCCRLLAVQRGLPSRSFSSGGSQLIRVMVKESVAYTRAARQRCGTACARSHAHRAAYDRCTAEHCCRPVAWRTLPPRTCSHPNSSPLTRSGSYSYTAARWAAGWACRQRPWSRRASMVA
jgi:hypothetical protein